jgi:hypothetical protein
VLTPHPDRTTKLHIKESTIYYKSGLGISKIKCRELLIETGSYAQYDSAVFVTLVPEGARKPRAFVQTSEPDLVVLAGHRHLDPDDPMLPAEDRGNGISVSRGRYMSCDPRWRSDFDAKLATYLGSRGLALAADFRGHNPRERSYSRVSA